ncbi:MAG TPA: hypothetical protein VFB81_07030, partial [Myxococcales bacterium]|nr:hypothetical protein [Myxococcales bacterium]
PLGALPGLLCWQDAQAQGQGAGAPTPAQGGPVSKVVNDLVARAREARGAFGALGSEAIHVVFRLIHAPIPALHSLRHPVDRVLAIEPA